MSKFCLFISLTLAVNAFGQNTTTNETLRSLFHKISTEKDLDELLSKKDKINTAVSEAYFGSAQAMKAKYSFLPQKKYEYFTKGRAQIEHSIQRSKSVENIYLRLMVQLNAPGFLDYNNNIQSDINFINKNIKQSSIPTFWKKKFLKSILSNKSKKYDFSNLEQKLRNLN